MRGPRRSSSATPSASSSLRTWIDTAGWLDHTRSAARVMLPSRATWQNARSCLSRLPRPSRPGAAPGPGGAPCAAGPCAAGDAASPPRDRAPRLMPRDRTVRDGPARRRRAARLPHRPVQRRPRAPSASFASESPSRRMHPVRTPRGVPALPVASSVTLPAPAPRAPRGQVPVPVRHQRERLADAPARPCPKVSVGMPLGRHPLRAEPLRRNLAHRLPLQTPVQRPSSSRWPPPGPALAGGAGPCARRHSSVTRSIANASGSA